MTPKLFARLVALFCLFAFCASVAARAEDAAALVQKGFYLQVHDRDLAGAAAAFERVATDATAPADLRREAQTRLAQCREELAAANLARLMPADAIAYVELNRPGDHLVRLAKMMGLIHGPGAEPAATNEERTAEGIPLGPGLVFPANFTLSPALAAELKKFRGAALAITGLDERLRGMPDGVLVIDPGDSDLVRGLLETGVQFIEPASPIGSFKTYHFNNDRQQFWIAVTARLVIAGTKREAVAGTIERLGDPKASSLATRPTFKAHDAERRNSFLFAYVDGPETARRLRSLMRGRDAAVAASLLDLGHLESITFTAGVTDDSVRFVARMNLAPGHHNVAYNLIRTPPFTGRSLKSVPSGAAAVVVVGLNPPTPGAPAKSGDHMPAEVTGMDVGREIFANVEEVAFFVLPTTAEHSTAHTPLPAMAAVFAVKDADKSEALWNQILAIASLFGVHDPQPHDITVDGKPGKQYQFHGLPPVVVLRAADRELIVGTEAAASAALRANNGQQSIATDEAYRKLLARLTPTSSKAVLVDVSRALQLAVSLSHRGHDPETDLAAAAVKDLRLSIVTDETPNCLTVRVEASGLPNVHSLIRMSAGRMARTSSAKK